MLNFFKKSKDTSTGVFVPNGSGFVEVTDIDGNNSFNDVAEYLGHHGDTLQSYFMGDDTDIDGVAFEVFTRNVVFVMTKKNVTELSPRKVNAYIKDYDPSVELDSFFSQEVLKDGIENQSLSVDFLQRVLGLNDNNPNSVLYSDRLGLYLYFSNGYLEDFQSADGLNENAKDLKKMNPELLEDYRKEATAYWVGNIKKVLKEINMQADALFDTPNSVRNKYRDLHVTTFGNINYVNLLVAHYKKIITLDDFLELNHGRYEDVSDSQRIQKIKVGNFIYESDGRTIVGNSLISK